MGEIWLAERKGISGFSKQVVVKTILESYIDEPGLVQMFLDEGRIAANLTHPNIAMEYVHGQDLRNLLIMHYSLGQHIPLNLVLQLAAQTCEGLYYAHQWKDPDGKPAGIVHRDISPQNVLGVVMYELLTGRRLFKRDSELATLDAVIRSVVPPPTHIDPSVPRQVEKLVLAASGWFVVTTFMGEDKPEPRLRQQGISLLLDLSFTY